jgi:hypothetical protein
LALWKLHFDFRRAREKVIMVSQKEVQIWCAKIRIAWSVRAVIFLASFTFSSHHWAPSQAAWHEMKDVKAFSERAAFTIQANGTQTNEVAAHKSCAPAEQLRALRLKRIDPPTSSPDAAIGFFAEPRMNENWLTVPRSSVSGATPSALYVFRWRNSCWNLHQTLETPSGRMDDGFGSSVALYGKFMVVAAPEARVNDAQGAVYVYRFQGRRWMLIATVTSPRRDVEFGVRVALDHGLLAVGAAHRVPGGAAPRNGVVFLFAVRHQEWLCEAEIAPPAELRGKSYKDPSEAFGGYIDMSDGRLAVSSMGENAVFIYDKRRAWELAQRIDAPRNPGDSPEGPAFARNVDLDGDILVVGGLRAQGVTFDSGAVWVYRLSRGVWIEESKLIAWDGAKLEMFGHWVAHDRGIVAVGAFRHAASGIPESGAAYLFRRVGSEWRPAGKFTPPAEVKPKLTGYALDFNNGRIALGGGTEGNPEKSLFFWVGNVSPKSPVARRSLSKRLNVRHPFQGM